MLSKDPAITESGAWNLGYILEQQGLMVVRIAAYDELQHRLALAEAVCEEFGEVTIPPEDGLEKVTALIFQKKLQAWQAAVKGER